MPISKDNNLVLYYTDEYLKVHNSKSVIKISDQQFTSCFLITDQEAYSFGFAPFGSIQTRIKTDFQQFRAFENSLCERLYQQGVKKIWIRQPPFFYPSFIDPDWLIKVGYQVVTKDCLQYIDLHSERSMHPMENRKLNQLNRSDFTFKMESEDVIPEVHQFLSTCRKSAHLEINISLKKLLKLFQVFPNEYTAFTLRDKGHICSAAIMVEPLKEIAYYYLPGTHPNYKKLSPMVLLLERIIDHYKRQNTSIIDLGLSSINGIKQEGLFTFKQRMGAQSCESLVYEKSL